MGSHKGVPFSSVHRASLSAAHRARAERRQCAEWTYGGHQCSDIRRMPEVERAYVGALIDTDGCVYQRAAPRRGWTVEFLSMDVELISAILRAVGRGHVRLVPKSVAGQIHDIWMWSLNCQCEIGQLADQCSIYSLKLSKTKGVEA